MASKAYEVWIYSQRDLVYPDYFIPSNNVGLARYPIIGIESIKSEILFGVNANNVN